MAQPRPWLDEVIDALEKIGGYGTLQDITEKIIERNVRKFVIEYLKMLHKEEILCFVHFHINNSTTKNYCTRWIHKEHTTEWAIGEAEYQYKMDRNIFNGGGIGVSEE